MVGILDELASCSIERKSYGHQHHKPMRDFKQVLLEAKTLHKYAESELFGLVFQSGS